MFPIFYWCRLLRGLETHIFTKIVNFDTICQNHSNFFQVFVHTLLVKKTGVNFSRVKLLAGEKNGQLYKIDHFSLTKLYTSQVSKKALLIPFKFYFKNRKLINGQVNWFIKINVNVPVFLFFLTIAVGITDQF